MRKPNLTPNIADVVKFTKEKMLCYYRLRDREGIEKEYINFRIFTRFLFIRGAYGSFQLRCYLNNSMEAFAEMLLEPGADWRK